MAEITIKQQAAIKRWFLAYLRAKDMKMKDAPISELRTYTDLMSMPTSNASPIADVESGELLYIQKAAAE